MANQPTKVDEASSLQPGSSLAIPNLDKGWELVNTIKHPINLFALGMMLCSATFAFISITLAENAFGAFVYVIHMFMAIVGMFFLIAIYCPRSLAIQQQKPADPTLSHSPDKACIWACVGLVMYLVYQVISQWYQRHP